MKTTITQLETILPVTSLASVVTGILAALPSGMFYAHSASGNTSLSSSDAISMHRTGHDDLSATFAAPLEELGYTKSNSGLTFTGNPITTAAYGRMNSRTFGEFVEDVFRGRYSSFSNVTAILIDQVEAKIYIARTVPAGGFVQPTDEFLVTVASNRDTDGFFE
jgi:hypothetical protein